MNAPLWQREALEARLTQSARQHLHLPERAIPESVPSRSLLAVALLLFVAAIGCGRPEIATTYGQRRGAAGGPSVNGTAVFAGMFEEAGHRVITWRRLSPKLDQCDTIVWFPDDFQPPTLEQRDFLEWWLFEEPDRTVIYVGRDYDAEVDYWRQVQEIAPASQVMEVTRRLATAQARHDAARASMPAAEPADWFTLWRDEPHRKVESIEGPWSEDIDISKAAIELNARLEVLTEEENEAWFNREDNLWDDPAEYTRLLASEGESIITRVSVKEWDGSKILVVSNGSCLLNLPLVNHENRRLAGKLIEECSPGRVVFLESGFGGPTVYDDEPGAEMPTGFAAFTVWPLGFILMHFAVFGILLCVALFPIFGRPRGEASSAGLTRQPPGKPLQGGAAGLASAVTGIAPPSAAPSVVKANFGKHITALGELLETTEDRQYARERVIYYHEHVKRDSGASHRNK